MRLRFAEYLAGAAAIIAIVDLFVLHFSSTAATGWDAITVLRWFVLVGAVLGLAAVAAQGLRRGAALAVTLDMITMLVAGLTTILLAIKLATTSLPLAAGAYVLVVAVAALALGGLRAMRVEQGWTPGPEHPVDVVELSAGS